MKTIWGRNLIIGYSVAGKQLFIDRTKSGNSSFSERFAAVATAPYEAVKNLKMHLFIDASSAELFIDDGKLVMTSLFFPAENYYKTQVLVRKMTNTYPEKIDFYELGSIWP